MIVDPARLDQAIAQLPQIAGAAAPRHDPSQRPAQVRRAAQNAAQITAQQGIVMQPLDQRQPRLDDTGIGQRSRKIIGQLPRTGPGDAAIDRFDQTAAPPALAGNEDFQAGPGCLIHRQVRCPVARHWRQQQRQFAPPGMVEIGDQPACRSQHRTGKAAKSIERRNTVHRLQPCFTAIAGEIPARARNRI